jgi:hypothetical protein
MALPAKTSSNGNQQESRRQKMFLNIFCLWPDSATA